MDQKYDQSCEILGSRISVLNQSEVVTAMREIIPSGSKGYICVANVHTTVTGWRDPDFRKVNNESIIATADGVPLVWASKFLKPQIHGRASGPDIMAQFFNDDDERRFRHFLFGSTQAVLDSMRSEIEKRWPHTQIVGTFSPPFRPASAQDDLEHAALVNDAKADIVWVGLGAPRQELWMNRMRPRLQAPLLIGVGAAFDFLSGNKPRAPLWMQNFGLEWLFRLLSEPRRLFTRYAVTNSLFLWGVLQQILGRKF